MSTEKSARKARKILLRRMNIAIYFYNKVLGIKNPDYIFEKTWGLISRSRYIDRLLPKISHWILEVYQLGKSEYLYFELVGRMKERGFRFSPRIHPANEVLWAPLYNPTEGAIIVSVHTGFAFNVRILSDRGRKVCTISSYPDISKILDRSGVEHPVDIIRNDRYSLAYVKDIVLKGGIASVAIDFKQDTEVFEYVSPALFEFSNRLKIPMYFSRCRVLSDGSLSVDIAKAPENTPPLECAQAFIDFVNESADRKRKLSVQLPETVRIRAQNHP